MEMTTGSRGWTQRGTQMQEAHKKRSVGQPQMEVNPNAHS